MHRSVLALLLLGLAAPALPSPAHAVDHVFEAPEFVVAAPDGDFVVVLRITLGTGGGSLAHGYLEGRQNCLEQLYADGFCLVDRPEGYTLELPLYGSLTDPASPGRVYVEASVCSDLDQNFWATELDVEPYTVPVETESFGLVKARYRR